MERALREATSEGEELVVILVMLTFYYWRRICATTFSFALLLAARAWPRNVS